jgi:hypothetical protein
VGTLEQVSYYENPGILMIVQSVEDQAVSKLARGKKLPGRPSLRQRVPGFM